MTLDDELIFAEEEPTIEEPSRSHKWKLLVVDDDRFVHKVTHMVLQDYTFEGQKVEILSAHSATEGKRLLKEHPDTAVVLLDVVMETTHAGLHMAAWIRDELDNQMVRIILRTGQPGEAPEQEVIFKYDINDYKEKSELTSQKLATTVTTAIRSYRDIWTIERHRQGLSRIVKSSPTLFKTQSLSEFTNGVLTLLASTITMEDNTILARASGLAATRSKGDFTIIASTGKFEENQGQALSDIDDEDVAKSIEQAVQEKSSFFTEKAFVGYYRTSGGSENVIYLNGVQPLEGNDQQLLNLFSSNISVAFDNIDLNHAINETQKELLFTLGEVVETRSSEAANHVRRVAEYSYLLGKKSGMSEEDADRLKLASPMHDVGKIGIPDSVLLKPGRLDEKEFDTIKQHTTIGYEILKGSNRPVLQTAATIAFQHHERWDGQGYPLGLKGEEIDLNSRITMLADVFDALGSKRCYKDSWEQERIEEFILENRGTHFDPSLVDLLLKNMDEIKAIREKFPDEI